MVSQRRIKRSKKEEKKLDKEDKVSIIRSINKLTEEEKGGKER